MYCISLEHKSLALPSIMVQYIYKHSKPIYIIHLYAWVLFYLSEIWLRQTSLQLVLPPQTFTNKHSYKYIEEWRTTIHLLCWFGSILSVSRKAWLGYSFQLYVQPIQESEKYARHIPSTASSNITYWSSQDISVSHTLPTLFYWLTMDDCLLH